jgi:subtilisin family serine protease
VIVAVLDTGIDYLHPDLDPRSLWRNPSPGARGRAAGGYTGDVIGWNFVDRSNNPWDGDGHGTFVAGLIGAASDNGRGIAGINWGVRIMPLKVMNVFGRGRAFDVARAIIYAAEHGARVINLSVEGEQLTQTEQRAIDYAHAKGALIVVAAGNQGMETTDRAPASFERVLPVAAVDAQDRRAGFSNWGRHVKLAAPGVDLLSLRARRSDFLLMVGAQGYRPGDAFVGPERQLQRASGTSFAAPLVSGVASLIWARFPHLTNVQVERMLLESADDVDAPGWDQHTGAGRLNAVAALRADPDYFLTARVTRVAAVRGAGGAAVEVRGVAAGSRLDRYEIELGQGAEPSAWKTVATERGRSVASDDGLIGQIPMRAITARGAWTVRLRVFDTAGRVKEARGALTVR